jgi:hypothetical protein
MALKGTLRDFSLADIFQLIGLQKKTGVLTLKNGQEVVTVSFLEGNVVAADSLHRRIEDRLGTVLVKTKQITPAQQQEALKVQKQTLKRLGNVLVEQKLVSQEALREALRIQVTQMIYRLFRWRDGDYEFSQESKLDFDRQNVIPLSAESVLMEGARILDEWPMIEKRIGPLTGIYARTESANRALKGGSGQASPVLSAEEKAVLQLLGENKTVQDVIESNTASEFDTCRVLYELIGRQLAEKVAVGEVSAPSKPAPKVRPPVEPVVRERSSLWGRLMVGLVVGLSLLTAPLNPLNGLSLPGTGGATLGEFRHQVSRTRLERLHYAIQVFFILNRGYPQDLNYLVVGGLLRPEDLRDPWGREYLYRTVNWGYELQGFGPEGKADPALLVRSINPR